MSDEARPTIEEALKEARACSREGLPRDAQVLVSVGTIRTLLAAFVSKNNGA
jgi:hypothetical protein